MKINDPLVKSRDIDLLLSHFLACYFQFHQIFSSTVGHIYKSPYRKFGSREAKKDLRRRFYLNRPTTLSCVPC